MLGEVNDDRFWLYRTLLRGILVGLHNNHFVSHFIKLHPAYALRVEFAMHRKSGSYTTPHSQLCNLRLSSGGIDGG